MSSKNKGGGQEGALVKNYARPSECACQCVQQGRHIAYTFKSRWEVGVIKAFDKKALTLASSA